MIVDVDATRQAARQRALTTHPEYPAPRQRLDEVCAPAYLGRKRGEVGRSRTTLLQAHTQQWLGTFSGAGNGDYVAELVAACRVVTQYLHRKDTPSPAHWCDWMACMAMPRSSSVFEPPGLGFLTRGRDYQLLTHPRVLARLTTPCDCELVHPETGVRRDVFEVGSLSDWLDPLFKHEVRCRVIVTRRTVPAPPERVTVGKQIGNFVYELFLTSHPVQCLQAADVVQLYLQRGSFEQVLSDEDVEQDPDRWCSYTPLGQECWQIISQWVWNLRLELGSVQQQLQMRQTHLLQDVPLHSQSATSSPSEECKPDESMVEQEVESYGPVELTQEWANAHGRFAGKDFVLLDEATLRCPADKLLRARSRLPLPNGNLRIYYSARIVDCRSCPLASQCIGQRACGNNPRQVSGIRHPIEPIHRPKIAPCHEQEDQPERPKQEPAHALLWSDVSGRALRRDWFRHLRRQHVTVEETDGMPLQPSRETRPQVLTRAQRTHARLSWHERQARNQNTRSSTQFRMMLFGVAPQVAAYLNLSSIALEA